jgi:hypothetical protein
MMGGVVTWVEKRVYLKSQFVARSDWQQTAFSDQPWRNACHETTGQQIAQESMKHTSRNVHEKASPGDQSMCTVFAVSFQQILFKKVIKQFPLHVSW